MDSEARDELYSDNYKTSDFTWGVTLGEGRFIIFTRFSLSFDSQNFQIQII